MVVRVGDRIRILQTPLTIPPPRNKTPPTPAKHHEETDTKAPQYPAPWPDTPPPPTHTANPPRTESSSHGFPLLESCTPETLQSWIKIIIAK